MLEWLNTNSGPITCLWRILVKRQPEADIGPYSGSANDRNVDLQCLIVSLQLMRSVACRPAHDGSDGYCRNP
jgi:hypothetical protein